jgi:hypothetical protein
MDNSLIANCKHPLIMTCSSLRGRSPKQSGYLGISGLLHSVRNDAAFVISLLDKHVY